jgi:hypothetical protein
LPLEEADPEKQKLVQSLYCRQEEMLDPVEEAIRRAALPNGDARSLTPVPSPNGDGLPCRRVEE